MRRFLFWVGWKLMGFPIGVREPNMTVLRYGPYRWGAWLANIRCGRDR
jgi:hypothetical protein